MHRYYSICWLSFTNHFLHQLQHSCLIIRTILLTASPVIISSNNRHLYLFLYITSFTFLYYCTCWHSARLLSSAKRNPSVSRNQLEPRFRRTFHTIDNNNKPSFTDVSYGVQNIWRYHNALYTGSHRRFGDVYCLNLQIGLQPHYLPVFTALYPTRLESLTRNLFTNLCFRFSNCQ